MMIASANTTRIRSSRFYRGFELLGEFLVHGLLLVIALACIIPMVLIVSASFSKETEIAMTGYGLFPRGFTVEAYDYIFKVPSQIIRAYGVTIFVTAVGSMLSLFVMSLLAYVISRPDFPFRKQLSFYVFVTMLFSGGLVPWYIWLTQGLHLTDTIWALILPYLIVPWYVILLRTYFASVPQEIIDSATIDGAGEWRAFFQIVLPLSRPGLATVGLFLILNYWNDWWLALLFINDRNLQPLQYMLYSILTNARAIQANVAQSSGMTLPLNTVRMAMSVLATGPGALVFLILQPYFIRGLMAGAIKE
jgi:putative aldouronate transport system permease protein